MSFKQTDQRCSSVTSGDSQAAEGIEEKLLQAERYLGMERLDRAAVLYGEVVDAHPDNLCALFNLAVIHHAEGQLCKAIGFYKQVLVRDPENFQVLFNLASAFRDNGFPEQSAVTFQRALEIEPSHLDIHYNLGVLCHQLGFTEAAVENFENILAVDPGHSAVLYNLGTICFANNILNKALDFYGRAHAADPDDMDCCYNLGLTHFQLGDFEEAISCFEPLLAANQDDASLCNTIGTAYRHLDELEMATVYYQKALALQPDFGSACANLAVVSQMRGDTAAAVDYFQRAMTLGHEVESAEYMIAALTGVSRSSVPRSYIEGLFDSYAVDFDKSLVSRLDYDVPAKLFALHESVDDSNSRYGQVIDLGCGTGLAGEQFRDLAVELTGVDLSSKMVEQADRKEIYDHLHCDDIVGFLENSRLSYDLVIAADVMVYIGELEPLFAATTARLAPKGLFLFSVEEHAGEDYHLCQSGRYAYSGEYIERLAAENNLSIVSSWQTNIRREKGQWITGNLFALQSPPSRNFRWGEASK